MRTMQRSFTDAHGLVRPWERGRSFELDSAAPSRTFGELVDRYWMVRWNRSGQAPFRQEILPHPSVNLVFEPDGARIWGVVTRRQERQLEGSGWALGAKLNPGVFTVISGVSAAAITDGSMALSDLLGDGTPVLEITNAAPEMRDGIDAIESALRRYLGVDDPSLQLLQSVFADMQTAPADARVADVARRAHVAPRTLQKLFRRYVGVGPKWALTRLRIHRALERLSTSPPAWTELALELGYYDHAHFIRDFRLVVGRSPSQFVAEAAAAGS